MNDDILDDFHEDNRPVRYAGFWLRVAAILLDGIILNILIIPFYFIFILRPLLATIEDGTMDTMDPNIDVISFITFYIVTLLLMIGYFVGFECSAKQGTWGKQIVGIKVTNLRGERISFGQSVGRYFSKFLSLIIMYIGFIMAGFTEKKQALHDMVASTLVVRK